MTKISLAAAYHISASYLLRIVTLLLICSVNALAKNNCDTNASQVNPAKFSHSEIDGTGAVMVQSGIGGTGLHDGGAGGTGSPAESGIGGTGSVASDGGVGGTGIIGVITGFASICVNGVEIHYDADTPVSIDGQPSTMRDLAVGQVVAARTLGAGDELAASNIAIIHAVVGPISYFNPEIREMQVLGQTIQIGQLRDADNFSNLKTGDWIQVSGHRLSNGAIIASRIESTQPAEARINGYVTQIDAAGFEINGTRINHDTGSLPAGLVQGMEVRVAGDWDGAYLNMQHIQTEPTRQSIGNVEHVVIEGYIHALDERSLSINNQIIAFDSAQVSANNARSDFRLDQRVQISGRLGTDQRVIVEHIELKHEATVHQQHERNDRNQIDGSGKDKNRDGKNNPENEPQIKPLKGNHGGQRHYDNDDSKDSVKKDSDDNNRESLKKINDDSHGRLKKEIDHSSHGNRSQEKGNDSPLENSLLSGLSGDGEKSGYPGTSGREHMERSLGDREQNYSDHKSIDRFVRQGESDLRDGSADHRDNLRHIDGLRDSDNDQGSLRDIDSHRDSLRSVDMSDRVRDHGGVHHDRDFHHDRHFHFDR